MAAGTYCVTVLFIFVCAILVISCSSISKEMRLQNNVFFSYGGIESTFVCGMLCLQSLRCEAFNYRSANLTCSLVDKRVNSTAIPEPGYVFSDIVGWNNAIAGPCATKPCDSNSFCVRGTSGYKCIKAAWAQ